MVNPDLKYSSYLNQVRFCFSMLAQLLLRLGLAGVFVWFGVDKFLRPDIWVVQMPEFLQLYGVDFIFFLGASELVIGVLFLSKKYFRIGALGAVGILIGAIGTLGWNDIAVRDAGLLVMAFSLMVPWTNHVTPKAVLAQYVDLMKRGHK